VTARDARERWATGSLSLLYRDPVLLLIGAATLLLAFWFLVVPAGVDQSVVAFWAPQPFIDLCLLVSSHRIAGLSDVSPAIRRFWRWMSRAGGLFAIGDSAQTLLMIRHPDLAGVTGSLFQAAFVGSGMALMVVVMLSQPTGVTGAERRRLWLDASTVTVGAAVFVWYLNAESSAGPILTTVMPVVVLASVFSIVQLAIGAQVPFTLTAGIVGLSGVSSYGLVMALQPQVSDSPHLGLELLVRLLPAVLIGVTPRIQELQIRVDPTVLSRRRRRPYSRLPYVAVAATHGLLVVALASYQFAVRGWGVMIGVIAITTLVIIRQLAALHDNAMLLTRLDANMAELRHLHEQLNHQASHDPLTQLANRNLFQKRVHDACAPAVSGDILAVLMIDLDDFKPINDQYGHPVGDGLLIEVSRRLSACVRSHDTVARLGGDEFSVLLPGSTLEQAAGVAQRIVDSLQEVILVDGHLLQVSASVGVAVGPAADPIQAATILKDADAAMYVAKRSGKGNYHLLETSV
jgi:diguanylate cyclase